MTRVSLLPRLNALGMSNFLSHAKGNTHTSKAAIEMLQENASMISFAASGGTQDFNAAGRISNLVKEVAAKHGFPEAVGQKAKAAFDVDCAVALAQCPELATGEALRNDTWAFLSGVMLPDIVEWRFPGAKAERYEGGVRNTMQRLWMRGVVLDRGPGIKNRWGLLAALTEDAMVQIFERPSISADATLARAIAEGWVATANKIGSSAMEDVMRRATKLLRIHNEIIDLGFLPNEQLQTEVIKAFSRVSGVPEVELAATYCSQDQVIPEPIDLE